MYYLLFIVVSNNLRFYFNIYYILNVLLIIYLGSKNLIFYFFTYSLLLIILVSKNFIFFFFNLF